MSTRVHLFVPVALPDRSLMGSIWEVAVDAIVERCAGIDVGKANLKATLRVQGGRGRRTRREVRTFGTMTPDMLQLRDWLVEERVSLVGIESTGVYWKPTFYLLEDVIECWLLNARHLKKVPGRKSDVSDSEWIAELVAHGWCGPASCRLRRSGGTGFDAVSHRANAGAHPRQRLQNLLEDAGIKLDCVVSDITGVSARHRLTALVEGERDVKVLAEYAQGRMRPKVLDLQRALVGNFTEHHARLCHRMLSHIDSLTRVITDLTENTDAQMQPFDQARHRLTSIPGVSERVAEVLIAKTGGGMSRFPTPQQLASWAAMCPGNNESAGKSSSRYRPGRRSVSVPIACLVVV